MSDGTVRLTIDDLRRCIEGRIPPVLATADGAGEPNVVFVSAVYVVDAERIALSNQFMGKSAANLVENPRASILLTDPVLGHEYRLQIAYERTERRGPVFERLRTEVDEIAAATGQGGVFRLRSADIYHVERIDLYKGVLDPGEHVPRRSAADQLGQLGELVRRLSRCADLDTMVGAAVRGLDELLGYERSLVMLLDETGSRLFTIASHGFPAQGVGSELALGEGAAGQAAERNRPVRLGGVHYVNRYILSLQRAYEGGEYEIPMPSHADTRSRLAVPAVSRGEVRGVVVVESRYTSAFEDSDETVLGIVGSVIAEMADLDHEVDDDPAPTVVPSTSPGPTSPRLAPPDAPPAGEATHVRFFTRDGSVFLDGEYLIRGVAGRILWSMVQRYTQAGQLSFTTKEIRLDPSLDLPSFRDNLDTRLILLKRRLEERSSPIQLVKTGRGRFRLDLQVPTLRLELHE